MNHVDGMLTVAAEVAAAKAVAASAALAAAAAKAAAALRQAAQPAGQLLVRLLRIASKNRQLQYQLLRFKCCFEPKQLVTTRMLQRTDKRL